MSPRGPELIGDVSPTPGFIPWNSYTVDVCQACGSLVPRDWQPSHAKYHQDNQDGLPTWPEDWRQQIKILVMQAWADSEIGAEGLTGRLINAIECWEEGQPPEAGMPTDPAAMAALRETLFGQLPGIDNVMADLVERGLVEEVEPCPSLLLRDGQLFACSKHEQDGDRIVHCARLDNVDVPFQDGVFWFDDTDDIAVPRPWPAEQEPPAGITCLRDSGRGDAASVRYLLRVADGWAWSAFVDPKALTGGTWEDQASLRMGDLVVMPPGTEHKPVAIDDRPAGD